MRWMTHYVGGANDQDALCYTFCSRWLLKSTVKPLQTDSSHRIDGCCLNHSQIHKVSLRGKYPHEQPSMLRQQLSYRQILLTAHQF